MMSYDSETSFNFIVNFYLLMYYEIFSYNPFNIQGINLSVIRLNKPCRKIRKANV